MQSDLLLEIHKVKLQITRTRPPKMDAGKTPTKDKENESLIHLASEQHSEVYQIHHRFHFQAAILTMHKINISIACTRTLIERCFTKTARSGLQVTHSMVKAGITW